MPTNNTILTALQNTQLNVTNIYENHLLVVAYNL